MDEFHAIGRKVARGSVVVACRTLVVQLLGLVTIVAFAHYLTPRDLGVLAFGFSLTAFGAAFADAGLAAGLIRSPSEPTHADLSAALGLQLVGAAVIGVLAAFGAALFGRTGVVTSIMAISLFFLALQTPAKVTLERQLSYRLIAIAEIAESLAYCIAVVTALAFGAGVWGVAVASGMRGLIPTVVLWTLRSARVWPKFRLSGYRDLVRFGIQFQAVNFANLIRDHGLNIAVGAILGLHALGIWSLAYRLLQAPLLAFGVVWRVSYPAMARIVALDSAPRMLLQRIVGIAGIISAVALAPIAASCTAIVPLVFGDEWRPAGTLVMMGLLGLVIGGPVSVAVAGYLYARNAPHVVLKSAIFHTAAWLAVSLPLLPIIGVSATGIGLVAGAVVDAVVLGRGAKAYANAQVARPLATPVAIAAVSIAIGVLAGRAGQTSGMAMTAIISGTTALVSAIAILGLAGALGLLGEVRIVRLTVSQYAVRAVRKVRAIQDPVLDAPPSL